MLAATFIGPEFLILFFVLLALVPLALTVWACIDIAKHPFKRENDKVIWILLAIFLSPIGPIIYYIKRNQLLAGPSQPTHFS